jgi:hypothetical protein
MTSFDTGLQHRVKRLVQQIADQHRHLMALRGEIAAALERGAALDVGNAFQRFEVALAAHFELEQRSFFPALHGLARSRTPELEALEREHAGFLAGLRALAADVGRVDAGATRAAFERQLAALRDHELREERLVAQIAERG